MITNELVSFIKAQRAAGKDDNFIRQALLAGGGWNNSDVDEALAIAGPSAMAIPKPPQPPAPPQQTVPRVQVMPSAPSSTAFAPSPAPRPVPQQLQSSPSPAPQVSAQAPSQPVVAPSSAQAQAEASVTNAQWQSMAGQFMPHQNPASPPQGNRPPSFTPKAAAPTTRSSHKGVYAFLVVALLVACGAGFAYLGGYLSFGAVSDPIVTDLPIVPEENSILMTEATTTNATSTDISFEDIEGVEVDDLMIDDLDRLMEEEF